MTQEKWEEQLARLIPVLQARAGAMLGGRHFGAGAPLAADLAQATLLKLREAGARERFLGAPFSRIRMYAFRVLHHHYIDSCHRKRLEALSATADSDDLDRSRLQEAGAHPANPEEALLQAENTASRSALLSAALKELTGEERDFLAAVLRTGSAPKAQAALGWPPGSASNACQRSNKILAQVKDHVQRRQKAARGTEED